MTDGTSIPADLVDARPEEQNISPELTSRFGEAAHLLDRLDLRPIDQRQPAKPWWRLWWPARR